MEGHRELSDVLNPREICLEDFGTRDEFQNLLNKFLFNLKPHLTLYDLPFQSYAQSKNVMV
jgi:hypothetical protein